MEQKEKRICCDFGNVGERHVCTQAGRLVNQENWEIEYQNKFVVQSNAGTELLRYTDADKIKLFIRKVRQQAITEERGRIRKGIEEMKTPSLARSEEIECCNCGEDLALESYDWYDEGYQDCIPDALSVITNVSE